MQRDERGNRNGTTPWTEEDLVLAYWSYKCREPAEAEYLRERILETQPGSLLKQLAVSGAQK